MLKPQKFAAKTSRDASYIEASNSAAIASPSGPVTFNFHSSLVPGRILFLKVSNAILRNLFVQGTEITFVKMWLSLFTINETCTTIFPR